MFALQVKATHEYQSRDSDELSFKKGDIIDVVPFEDPDDQVSMLGCSIFVELNRGLVLHT